MLYIENESFKEEKIVHIIYIYIYKIINFKKFEVMK